VEGGGVQFPDVVQLPNIFSKLPILEADIVRLASFVRLLKN
jgi:hypothetical protein